MLLSDDGETRPRSARPLDLVVSVGGDGTFLRAAYAASHVGCPVLGVKVGRMGFLTEVEPADALPLDAGPCWTARARIEERLAITVEPVAGADFPPQWGLNEVMVEKHARHRLVRLAVQVDGDLRDDVLGRRRDRGHPDGFDRVLVLGAGAHREPVRWIPSCSRRSPRTWSSTARSCWTPASHVQLEVMGEESGVLSADGRRSIELPVGLDRAGSARPVAPARLVRRDDAPGFLSLVREKFGLPGEPGERPGEPDGPTMSAPRP